MPKVADVLDTMDYGPSPEANTHVLSWLARHKDGFGHFIGGEFAQAASKSDGKAWIDVTNPANGAVLGRVPQGTAADVDSAVKAARKAFPAWSKLSGFERGKHLYALARHIQKRERFFAVLETMDNGKTIRESRDIDVPLVARHFYHHAGWAQLIDSEFPGYGPVGVCGQIIPWNFPLLMLAWKIAPALAAGNTVVLKPAEFTPLTALALAEACIEAGIPKGVVNIVTGDGETGAALVAHEDIDKIAFTGSTEVGRAIRIATAGTGKKLSLELGGKSPFIVFDDADLDAAVEGVVDAVWFNQGQVCCAGTRLLMQEGVAQRLIAKLKRRMETLRIGDPLDKSTDMGPLVAPVQLDRVRMLVKKGQAEGGTLIQAPGKLPKEGTYFPPSLFVDVGSASTVMQEEIFGPVISAMTFRTPDEAVTLANHTRYGLAASIWSENLNVALETAARMQAGVVWINSTNLVRCGGRLRWLQGKRLWPRGRARGAVRVSGRRLDQGACRGKAKEGCGPVGRNISDSTRRRRVVHRPHGKTLHRWQAGAARWRLFLRGAGQRRQSHGAGGPGQPQGHPQCRRDRREGDRLVNSNGAQPRASPILPGRKP